MVVLSGMLSSKTNDADVIKIDVIFFRHSSSFCLAGIDSEDTLPTAILASAVINNDLPVPCIGASTIAKGTWPMMTGRIRIENKIASALARLASSTNGNSSIT